MVAEYCEMCAIKFVNNDLEECKKKGWVLPPGSKGPCEGCGTDFLKAGFDFDDPPKPPPKAKAIPKKIETKQAAVVADKLATDSVRAILERIKYGYGPRCCCHDCRRIRDMIEKAGV